jgi:hypothetical protein
VPEDAAAPDRVLLVALEADRVGERVGAGDDERVDGHLEQLAAVEDEPVERDERSFARGTRSALLDRMRGRARSG